MALRALRRPSGSVLHEQINALGLITPAGLFDATKTSMGPHSPKVPVVVGPMHERAQTHTSNMRTRLFFALRGRITLVLCGAHLNLYNQYCTFKYSTLSNIKMIVILDSITIPVSNLLILHLIQYHLMILLLIIAIRLYQYQSDNN